ncbi:MAG: hypothetical protein JRH18_10565 [Deltaproteobacteria bacterium]|nr:hypothetical protein [Deltaproteobacteria bacterium]MBW2152098.1 hypothetical protein [Deltaproteobacteria bacterium]
MQINVSSLLTRTITRVFPPTFRGGADIRCMFLSVCISLGTVLFAGQAYGVEALLRLDEKWIGYFDEMVKRRKIRALVPYSKIHYFLDAVHQSIKVHTGGNIGVVFRKNSPRLKRFSTNF